MKLREKLINAAVVEFQKQAHVYLGDTQELSNVVRAFTAKLASVSTSEFKAVKLAAMNALHDTLGGHDSEYSADGENHSDTHATLENVRL